MQTAWAGALLLAVCLPIAAAASPVPLREARWLLPERQAHALSHAPTECLNAAPEASTTRRIEIGRTAFRSPLLLGGQAARAGLSCNSCHRNGRGNPDFLFHGLSGAPGTADVTSSLMSSHRGDGVINPVAIPDLVGTAPTVSRAVGDPALAAFIRGLIVEEFDGAEPSETVLAGIVEYVRALSPQACPAQVEQRVRLADHIDNARRAARAAQYALELHDRATARLMLSGARHELGLIDERYATPDSEPARRRLHDADLELAALQQAFDKDAADATLRITAWLANVPRWAQPLARDEEYSLFDPDRLKAALSLGARELDSAEEGGSSSGRLSSNNELMSVLLERSGEERVSLELRRRVESAVERTHLPRWRLFCQDLTFRALTPLSASA